MTFEDVTSQAGVGNDIRQSFQATWVDVDRDGWLDLHVINDRTFWADALYRNQGDGTFVDMAAAWGLDVQGYSMSSTVCDFDRDGDWDFVVTDGASEGNSFMQCAGGLFADENTDSISLTYNDVAAEAGVLLEELAWGALWLDANNDGWQDLFIGTGTSLYTDYPNVLELVGESPNGFWMNNQGQLPLQNAEENVFTDNEVTFSTAWADHNKDGAMDFVSHRIGPRARLLNGVPNGNHWVQLNLVPNEGNVDAIGAVVSVWKNGTPDMRVMTCGSGVSESKQQANAFRIGGTSSLDSVVVQWPSGDEMTYFNVEPDAINTIYEDAAGISDTILDAPTQWLAILMSMPLLTTGVAIGHVFVHKAQPGMSPPEGVWWCVRPIKMEMVSSVLLICLSFFPRMEPIAFRRETQVCAVGVWSNIFAQTTRHGTRI